MVVCITKIFPVSGDSIAQWLAYLLPDLADLGLNPAFPNFFQLIWLINSIGFVMSIASI